jgi:capsular polysaccharide transport system permease protein
MNMHGIIEPIAMEAPRRESVVERTRAWLRRNRVFVGVVFLPTLVAAIYLFAIASDQYESETHFLVKSADPTAMPAIGMNSVLSSVTGASAAQNDAMSVADYLTSHDAVANLRAHDQLIERFHRTDADLFSRLRTADPSPEKLLRYYRKQVKVQYNTETGITTLIVRAFRPEDAFVLSKRLLQLGEQRVNDLNVRSYNDAIAQARRQLGEAEDALAANQVRMTHYRQSRADIDPQISGTSQIGLVSQLTAQLSVARAQLNAMNGFISPSSPQYRALASHVEALQAQVNAQRGRLTGGGNTIASDIGGYEDLKLRQEFLAKRYDAAATALQQARQQALKQQLYVVHVVEPNMPVKSEYPHRWRVMATILLSLLLAYSIGWLIAAGVREHAA